MKLARTTSSSPQCHCNTTDLNDSKLKNRYLGHKESVQISKSNFMRRVVIQCGPGPNVPFKLLATTFISRIWVRFITPV